MNKIINHSFCQNTLLALFSRVKIPATCWDLELWSGSSNRAFEPPPSCCASTAAGRGFLALFFLLLCFGSDSDVLKVSVAFNWNIYGNLIASLCGPHSYSPNIPLYKSVIFHPGFKSHLLRILLSLQVWCKCCEQCFQWKAIYQKCPPAKSHYKEKHKDSSVFVKTWRTRDSKQAKLWSFTVDADISGMKVWILFSVTLTWQHEHQSPFDGHLSVFRSASQCTELFPTGCGPEPVWFGKPSQLLTKRMLELEAASTDNYSSVSAIAVRGRGSHHQFLRFQNKIFEQVF